MKCCKIHNFLYCLVVVLMCTSCHMRPFGVLSEKEMEEVLVDMHLTTAAMNIHIPMDKKAIRQKYLNTVFEKHGITREKFEKSLDWYTRNPRKFEIVYEEVEKRLEQMNTDVDNFVYHPELNPANDTIDTVNVWLRPTFVRCRVQNLDSLSFAWNDSNFCKAGDRYIWSFVMTADVDTLRQSFVKFGVDYVDGTSDTIKHFFCHQGLRRRLTIKHCMREQPVKIWGSFFETENLKDNQFITIDTVSLLRIYNKQQNPLDSTWRVRMDSIQKNTTNELSVSKPFVKMNRRNVNDLMTMPEMTR